MLKFGHLSSTFWKTNVRFEISTFEIGYMLYLVKRLESWYFLVQKADRFGYFWLVLGRFDLFQCLVTTPLKYSFRSISQRSYRAFICGGWAKKLERFTPEKLQSFSRDFFWYRLSKNFIVESTTIFVCLFLSWSRQYSTKQSGNFDCL